MHHSTRSWDVVCKARSQDRLRGCDYLELLFKDYIELSGDRIHENCLSVRGGFATLGSCRLMVLAQNRGTCLQSRIEANFGMVTPAGFRKAIRLMLLAEKYNLPLLTFVDTPGAAADMQAELFQQSKAISQSLETMASLRVPIVSIVIGEGSSGGGLAMSMGDYLAMQENSLYSVISPEGCASILFKDSSRAPVMAERMGITSHTLVDLNLVDTVLPDVKRDANGYVDKDSLSVMQQHIIETFQRLSRMPVEQLLSLRYHKWSMVVSKRNL